MSHSVLNLLSPREIRTADMIEAEYALTMVIVVYVVKGRG